ncbi:hypothetical protein KQI38_20960 [Tissierella carlieri]|uniref:DUF6282 family protein n=1 Tax=Tissierella carlieri TaxID=689904 RepID=A0ABT1S6R0_9FIRM|nr:DUF6282 family protein [Tissierella carlieri]MBU5314496.1 hypothetical protein [Tissierella carlieri]MCQ4922153.1 DUF6282 family protein [Tissierella carlieri]
MDRKILEGIIDMHVHCGPSIANRELDAADMLKEAEAAGYAGFLVKDHYFPSMLGTKMVEKHLGNGTCKVYGSMCLNNSIGLFNLKALDTARQMDAKIVYFPTVSTKKHIDDHQSKGFVGGGKSKIDEEPVSYVDENGNMDPAAIECLKYMAEHDMVLGTGHGTLWEVDHLVKKAVELGVKRILVNHPHYNVGASYEDMKRWTDLGAYIELNVCVFVGGSKIGNVEDAVFKKIMDTVGVDRIIMDTDLGQVNNGSPVEGMFNYINLLEREFGVTEEEINTMTKVNPVKLFNL